MKAEKIIRIIITMYITCLYNFQLHNFLLCRNREHEAKKPYVDTCKSFHSFSIFSG